MMDASIENLLSEAFNYFEKEMQREQPDKEAEKGC